MCVGNMPNSNLHITQLAIRASNQIRSEKIAEIESYERKILHLPEATCAAVLIINANGQSLPIKVVFAWKELYLLPFSSSPPLVMMQKLGETEM